MAEQKTTTVKVLRAFLYRGQTTKAGDVLTVPVNLAAELVGMNKVERVAPPAPKPAPPKAEPKTEPKGDAK